MTSAFDCHSKCFLVVKPGFDESAVFGWRSLVGESTFLACQIRPWPVRMHMHTRISWCWGADGQVITWQAEAGVFLQQQFLFILMPCGIHFVRIHPVLNLDIFGVGLFAYMCVGKWIMNFLERTSTVAGAVWWFKTVAAYIGWLQNLQIPGSVYGQLAFS